MISFTCSHLEKWLLKVTKMSFIHNRHYIFLWSSYFKLIQSFTVIIFLVIIYISVTGLHVTGHVGNMASQFYQCVSNFIHVPRDVCIYNIPDTIITVCYFTDFVHSILQGDVIFIVSFACCDFSISTLNI